MTSFRQSIPFFRPNTMKFTLLASVFIVFIGATNGLKHDVTTRFFYPGAYSNGYYGLPDGPEPNCQECQCEQLSRCAYSCEECQNDCKVCNCRNRRCRAACPDRCSRDPSPHNRKSKCRRCKCRYSSCGFDCQGKCTWGETPGEQFIDFKFKSFDGYCTEYIAVGPTYKLTVIDVLTGRPVSGALVELKSSDYKNTHEATSDRNGLVTIGPVDDTLKKSSGKDWEAVAYASKLGYLPGPNGIVVDESKEHAGEVKLDLLVARQPTRDGVYVQFLAESVPDATNELFVDVMDLSSDTVVCTTQDNVDRAPQCQSGSVISLRRDKTTNRVLAIVIEATRGDANHGYVVMAKGDHLAADDYQVDLVHLVNSKTSERTDLMIMPHPREGDENQKDILCGKFIWKKDGEYRQSSTSFEPLDSIETCHENALIRFKTE